MPNRSTGGPEFVLDALDVAAAEAIDFAAELEVAADGRVVDQLGAAARSRAVEDT
jgi:hypothetical protein